MVVHHDGQGVAQDEAGPHHEVAQLAPEHLLRLAAENDQRNLAEHSQKSPGLKDKTAESNKTREPYFEHLERNTQQILVENG